MLTRSLIRLQSSPMGFQWEGALTAKVSLTPGSYDNTRTALFYQQLVDRVAALPGVEAVGGGGWLPVVEAGGLWGILAEGQSYDSISQGPMAVPQQVTPGWFAAMGIPLLRGRDVSDRDGEAGPYVAVISESAAEMLWPGADPLGRRFRVGGGNTYATVVGVVGDIRSRGFDDVPEPAIYFPFAQTAATAYFMPRSLSLVVRTRGEEPAALTPEIRAVVGSLDPTVPVSSVRTLAEVVGSAVASRRFSTSLIAGFAAAALLLAAFGIFSVVSHGVSERTYEIGVRVALGAERRTILALVVADCLRMAGAGIALGLLGAGGVARGMRALLVDVPAFDPWASAWACLALAVVVVLAAALPARRATRVDPNETLKAG
jgi:predicted permease